MEHPRTAGNNLPSLRKESNSAIPHMRQSAGNKGGEVKTAEEWDALFYESPEYGICNLEKFIQEIQSDAHRAGVIEGLRMAMKIMESKIAPIDTAYPFKLIRSRITELEKGKTE